MTSVKKYVYNEDGIRTSKTSNGVTTKFLLDGYNVIEQTDGTTTLHFFYDSNGEVIGFRYNGNDYFYVKNTMSDIIAITDSNKNIVAEYRYDPWGKVLDEENLTAIGILNPFRYRSYYYDSDIKMYYLQSRYYDAEVGRFINCDDVNYIGITESEVSYNPFAYGCNNAINSFDPSGYIVYDINSYKSSQWLFKLIRFFRKTYEQGKQYFYIDFVNYSLGIGLRIGSSVGSSLLNCGGFSYSDKTLTYSYMGISLFAGKKVGFSTSFDVGNYTIKGQYAESKKYESIAFSIISNFKNRQGKAYFYYSLNFTFFIYKTTKYVIKAATTAVCVVAPQLCATVKAVNSGLKAGSVISTKTLTKLLKTMNNVFKKQVPSLVSA